MEVNSDSVQLWWKAPTNTLGLAGYVIYKDGKEFAVVNKDITEYKVDGLRKNTIYGFKVSAKYVNGAESKPVSLNVRTKK